MPSQVMREPKPDPTILTTEQLHREILGLRELFDARIDAITKVIEERFRAVNSRFDLAEQQRVEQKVDTKTAVDAALSAQKASVIEQTNASERAIQKSEVATTKQLEQLQSNFATAMEGLRREIGDMKDRISDVDAKVSGVQNQKVGAKEDRTGLYVGLATIVMVLSIIASVIAFLKMSN